MGHFTKIRLEKFVETGNPLELLGALPAVMIDHLRIGAQMFMEYNQSASNSRDEANPKEEAHPMKIALEAMELYRSGRWEKEKAFRVVKEALEEYRNPRCGQDWQHKPISLPTLPGAKIHVRIEDVELLNQLFQ